MPPIPPDQCGPFGGSASAGSEHIPMAFRIRDAVRVSGLSKSTLYELAAAGKLKLSRVGGRTLVPRAELQRLIEDGQRAA